MGPPRTAHKMQTWNGGYQLSRTEVERRGRQHSARRALLVLVVGFAFLVPVWAVCRTWLGMQADIDSAVTARIALLIGALLVPCYVQFAFRCWELVRSTHSPRLLERTATAGLVLTFLAAGLHLVKVVLVWRRVEGQVSYPISLASGGFGTLGIIVLLLGLLVCCAAVALSNPDLWWRHQDGVVTVRPSLGALSWIGLTLARRARIQALLPRPEVERWKRSLEEDRVPPPTPQAESIICCSGGGIRSASFSLGGLQQLQQAGLYQSADAVIGVSGGGYIAAAMHVLRWQSPSGPGIAPEDEHWGAQYRRPFAGNSAELGRLRRNTNYLFNSARTATLALFSIGYGLAVNLVYCTVVLGAVAWWLGWYLNASGAIRGWATPDAVSGSFAGGWELVEHAWWLPLAGVLAYALERSLSRLGIIAVRSTLQALAILLTWVGLGLCLLLLVLPAALVLVHDYAAHSTSPPAALIASIGLVPLSVCHEVGLTGCGAGGVIRRLSPSSSWWASVAAVVTATVAVVRTASAKLPTGDTGSLTRTLLARLGAVVKHVLVPWIAFLVVLAVGLSLLLRWSVAPLAAPELLSRWDLAAWAGLAFLAVTVCTDANWTSLHHFYRERLASAFFLRRTGHGLEEVPYGMPLRFSRSAPPSRDDGPALVSCAVANVSDPDLVPAQRHGTPFVFSHDEIGLTDRMLPASRRAMSSSAYEFLADHRYRDVTITAATAMSGAAVSPLAGRLYRRIAPFRFVMALANARLGVWLPNPMWADATECVYRLVRSRRAGEVQASWARLSPVEQQDLTTLMLSGPDLAWLQQELAATEPAVAQTGRDRRRAAFFRFRDGIFFWFSRPSAFRLLQEAAGRTSVFDRKLYITDGGHYDNLGLVEALRRRARTIYVLDASNDAVDTFGTLGEAIATARMDLDCSVEIDWRPMHTAADGRAAAAWASGTVTYAEGEPGKLYVVKALLPETLSLDTEVYAGRHSDFPRTSTGEQLYGEFDLEAYRSLGEQATRAMLEGLRPSASVAGNGHRPDPVAQLVTAAGEPI